MKITRVTFGHPVSVVRGNLAVEWRPGKDGIESITLGDGGVLTFGIVGGARAVAFPPVGTVVWMEPDEPAATGSARPLPAPKARR